MYIYMYNVRNVHGVYNVHMQNVYNVKNVCNVYSVYAYLYIYIYVSYTFSYVMPYSLVLSRLMTAAIAWRTKILSIYIYVYTHMGVDRKVRVRKPIQKDHYDGERGLRKSFAMVSRK